ncbi:uncharacterized protein VTP21DRAFT_9370 [Calcarisporiella thermophila]|uniref:uncharacterized protein n=1 Tax=Calcarisporiella thermophila TaxID=911321 RepID=UPI0037426A29
MSSQRSRYHNHTQYPTSPIHKSDPAHRSQYTLPSQQQVNRQQPTPPPHSHTRIVQQSHRIHDRELLRVQNYTAENRQFDRTHSLIRPDRHRSRQPLIRDGSEIHRARSVRRPMVAPNNKEQPSNGEEGEVPLGIWTLFSWLVTCCVPGFLLRTCCGKKNKLVQQAWREKVALCFIILIFCGLLGFITYGLQPLLCPEKRVSFSYTQPGPAGQPVKVWREDVSVHGELYRFNDMRIFLAHYGIELLKDYQGVDLSGLFDATGGSCVLYDRNMRALNNRSCIVYSPYGGWIVAPQCIPLGDLRQVLRPLGALFFEWEDLIPNHLDPRTRLMVLNNLVLNMSLYLEHGDPYFGTSVHERILRGLGRDATAAFATRPETKDAMDCLEGRYAVGVISRDTVGCIAANVVMMLTLSVIVSLIMVRFTMAVVFGWFVSPRLVKPGGRHKYLPWTRRKRGRGEGQTELYTLMLVTCYSEGEQGLRSTFDSLAATTYSNDHKVFFIICDGLITGSGNEKSTPELVVDMLTLDKRMRDPKPCSYIAIADGEKQHNMAKVYAGHYVYKNAWVPAICIVKCGTPAEAHSAKPGNRGKRDSQVLLMTFFQRVLFNDRFTQLDHEIFWKLTWLMRGEVTPDQFELVLMVDADTRVLPESLGHMVGAMVNDVTIMGLCGETRIANKLDSWVTMIQVFEYYISHHYAKAFESMFGGVTCLPGCFCMYRIKAPKNDGWVPILANPDILLEYNQNVVATLHAKNLLLLGEDRFLSTLMLRTFPKRQMIFLPQAICKTVVPDTLGVLISQRRRWINSTIHNLMELVLVSDLCGIACLSMQFAVLIELVGTVVLPAAIVFTGWLLVSSIIGSLQLIPLLLLGAILGLPALLIVMTTTRKIVYVGWMIIYLLALPIWNLILPVYAYWHFDDFSWGQTRRVMGEGRKQKGTEGDKEGEFEAGAVVMKKWEEWERERLGIKKHYPLVKQWHNDHNSTKKREPSETTRSERCIGLGMQNYGEYFDPGAQTPYSVNSDNTLFNYPIRNSYSCDRIEAGLDRSMSSVDRLAPSFPSRSVSPRLSYQASSNSVPNLLHPPFPQRGHLHPMRSYASSMTITSDQYEMDNGERMRYYAHTRTLTPPVPPPHRVASFNRGRGWDTTQRI